MSRYYKPKSKKVIKIAAFIKGITGTIGMSALVADYKWIGITVLLLGAFANETINLFSDDANPEPVKENGNEQQKS